VKYEFDYYEDRNELKIIQNADKMYSSLMDIENYLRELRKGWKEDDKEKIMETINEILYESAIHEII